MKILLADDHPLFRDGVRPVLHKLDYHVEVLEARDFPGAFEIARRVPDLELAILDLYMPGLAGVEGVRKFRDQFPAIPVVVVSGVGESDDIQRLLAHGVLGYLHKSSPSDLILGALRLVLAGGVYVPSTLLHPPQDTPSQGNALLREAGLTDRQIEVLAELATGRSNRQIAETLNVTEGTVKIHLASIFKTLGVNSRTEALLAAQKMGLGNGRS